MKEDGFGNIHMTIGTLSRFPQNVATDDDKREDAGHGKAGATVVRRCYIFWLLLIKS